MTKKTMELLLSHLYKVSRSYYISIFL